MNTSTTTRGARGRGLLILGLCVSLGGVGAYAVQILSGRLWYPWYLPACAGVGTGLVAVSVARRANALRWVVLTLSLLLTAGTTAFVFKYRPQEYTGPVVTGKPFPVFTTSLADGTLVTQRDLAAGKPTVMVFFRGRW